MIAQAWTGTKTEPRLRETAALFLQLQDLEETYRIEANRKMVVYGMLNKQGTTSLEWKTFVFVLENDQVSFSYIHGRIAWGRALGGFIPAETLVIMVRPATMAPPAES